jgi:hypothetical protein
VYLGSVLISPDIVRRHVQEIHYRRSLMDVLFLDVSVLNPSVLPLSVSVGQSAPRDPSRFLLSVHDLSVSVKVLLSRSVRMVIYAKLMMGVTLVSVEEVNGRVPHKYAQRRMTVKRRVEPVAVMPIKWGCVSMVSRVFARRAGPPTKRVASPETLYLSGVIGSMVQAVPRGLNVLMTRTTCVIPTEVGLTVLVFAKLQTQMYVARRSQRRA